MAEPKDRSEAPPPAEVVKDPAEERARRRREPIPEEMPSGTFRIPRF